MKPTNTVEKKQDNSQLHKILSGLTWAQNVSENAVCSAPLAPKSLSLGLTNAAGLPHTRTPDLTPHEPLSLVPSSTGYILLC